MIAFGGLGAAAETYNEYYPPRRFEIRWIEIKESAAAA